MNKIMNEITLSLITFFASTYWLWSTLINGQNDKQVIAFIMFKISTYFLCGTLFTKFLNGIGFDINKEIFEEHNQAAANMVGMFWIGLAICIALGNLG
jgi:hypothetical protein